MFLFLYIFIQKFDQPIAEAPLPFEEINMAGMNKTSVDYNLLKNKTWQFL
jgi:hypothetical protein